MPAINIRHSLHEFPDIGLKAERPIAQNGLGKLGRIDHVQLTAENGQSMRRQGMVLACSPRRRQLIAEKCEYEEAREKQKKRSLAIQVHVSISMRVSQHADKMSNEGHPVRQGRRLCALAPGQRDGCVRQEDDDEAGGQRGGDEVILEQGQNHAGERHGRPNGSRRCKAGRGGSLKRENKNRFVTCAPEAQQVSFQGW
jgi:hypothetical protein